MVDNYRPEVEKLEERLDELEKEVFEQPAADAGRRILNLKRDVSSLRRVVHAAARRRRPAGAARVRRSSASELAYRFRDVYDHLVRLTDEAMFFQDRITGMLDAHLSTVVEPAEPGDEGADRDRRRSSCR